MQHLGKQGSVNLLAIYAYVVFIITLSFSVSMKNLRRLYRPYHPA